MRMYTSTFFLVLAGVGLASSLMCYQCGTWIQSSVTPCRDFNKTHLKECPPQSTHCVKYIGLASVVYGCETNCEEKNMGAFEKSCCNENQCNSGISLFEPKTYRSMGILSLSVAISFIASCQFLEPRSDCK